MRVCFFFRGQTIDFLLAEDNTTLTFFLPSHGFSIYTHKLVLIFAPDVSPTLLQDGNIEKYFDSPEGTGCLKCMLLYPKCIPAKVKNYAGLRQLE